MTVIADPLWEEPEVPDSLGLLHGLTAVYERDAAERAVRWAMADRSRWERVLDKRRSDSEASVRLAAQQVYEADKRERQAYVRALLKRGRAE